MYLTNPNALKKALAASLLALFCSAVSAAPSQNTAQEARAGKLSSALSAELAASKYDFAPPRAAFAKAVEDATGEDKKSEQKASRVPNFTGRKIAESALKLLGVPYVWGGNHERTGLDCSGFVRRAYQESVGLLLPRVAKDMAKELPRVEKSSLKAGDLVFFKTTAQAFSHVGVYMGGGYFAHAPRKGSVSRLDSLSSDYWGARFMGARRPVAYEPGQPLKVAGERSEL